VSMLPMAALMMPASALAPRLAKRIGTRSTMLSGLVIGAAGLGMLAVFASVEGGYLSVLPGLLVIGLGLGITMTPSTEAITESLPVEKQGVASALNDTSREVGGALGVALLGSILSAGYQDAIAPSLAGLPAEAAEVAREGIGGALGVAGATGNLELLDAAQHAFVEGWVSSMWVGVAMIAAAFVFVLVRGPRKGDDVITVRDIDRDDAEVDATDRVLA